MNLDQLEAITAIVDKGSFRAAAQHLNRSQSALSAMVKNFESEFEILLFDRSQYRPTLTPAGAAILAVARTTLEAAQFASRVAMELGKKSVETALRVSVDPLVSMDFIRLLTVECAKPSRSVSLVLDYSISKDDHSALLNGEVDLELVHCSRSVEKVERLFLEQVTLVAAIPKSLLGRQKKVTEAFLEKTTQVIAYHKRFDPPPDELIPRRVYNGHGPKVFVSDHFTKVSLIENGFGWGRVSEEECKSSSNLVRVPSEIFPELTLEMCLLRARNRALGPVGQEIWKSFEAYRSHSL